MNALLEKLKEFHQFPSSPRILDIGGWFAPCKQATHMVDLMPYKTLNRSAGYGFGNFLIQPENYHQMDLGAVERLPFSDKEFDFVICRHTLEDIRDPIRVCQEIIRIGKAGYIETPHRIYESTKGVERHWWCGHYHHRWLVEIEGQKITFQFKSHNIHSSKRYYFRQFPWQKVREEFKNTFLLWKDSFEFEEKIIFEYNDVKTDLANFKERNKNKKILRLKWATD